MQHPTDVKNKQIWITAHGLATFTHWEFPVSETNPPPKAAEVFRVIASANHVFKEKHRRLETPDFGPNEGSLGSFLHELSQVLANHFQAPVTYSAVPNNIIFNPEPVATSELRTGQSIEHRAWGKEQGAERGKQKSELRMPAEGLVAGSIGLGGGFEGGKINVNMGELGKRNAGRSFENRNRGFLNFASIPVAYAAEKTVSTELPRATQARLQATHLAADELTLQTSINANQLAEKIQWLQAIFNNDKTKPTLPGQGVLVLSSDMLAQNPELWKAVLQLFAKLELYSEENGMPSPYVFAGDKSALLKSTAQNKHTLQDPLAQLRLRNLLVFREESIQQILQKTIEREGKIPVASAVRQDIQALTGKILAAIDEPLDRKLSIEENAAIYYFRARLLKNLADQIAAEAVRLKKPVTEAWLKTFIPQYFQQMAGLNVTLGIDGSLKGFNSFSIHAKLQEFEARQQLPLSA